MAEIVTGEAVSLELPAAAYPSRLAARLIDTAVQGALFLFVLIPVILTTARNASYVAAALVASYVVLFVGYPTAFETLSRGTTLGQLARQRARQARGRHLRRDLCHLRARALRRNAAASLRRGAATAGRLGAGAARRGPVGAGCRGGRQLPAAARRANAAGARGCGSQAGHRYRRAGEPAAPCRDATCRLPVSGARGPAAERPGGSGRGPAGASQLGCTA